MVNLIVEAIILVGKAILLPAAVFFIGVFIMRKLSGHDYVKQQLRQKAAPENRRPLNMRFRGYDVRAVDQHWGVLDDHALKSEQRFLQMDLVFPLFYGAAFIAALWQAWSMLGRPFSLVWLIAPAAITVIADWTENLVQLTQLRLYKENGKAGLKSGSIRIASMATIVKLFAFTGMFFFLACLAVG